MKVFYPIFRWCIAASLIAVSIYQQYYWWTNDCVNSSNWFVSLLWFAVLVAGSVMLGYAIFPRQDQKTKHKFRCKFYSLKTVQTRVCTRTYRSIWKYCFKQMWRSRSLLFTIRQLDTRKFSYKNRVLA